MEGAIAVSTKQMRQAFAAWPQVRAALFVPHTERQYQELIKLMDSLIDEVGENEDHPLASLLEVVGVLIEKYEDTHVPELRSK
jgi:HTH-type transcriptional regulator/antitoxin HigA